jgi:ferredoxin
VKTVVSDECNTCLSCVDVCPVAETLDLRSILPGKKKIKKRYVAIGVVSIFMLLTGIGIISKHWGNGISKQAYLIHYKMMNSYGHPTGTAAIKEFNKEAASDYLKEVNTNNKITHEQFGKNQQ